VRWVNFGVIVIFAVVMLIFAAQNFQTVTIYFLTFKMSAPHAAFDCHHLFARHGYWRQRWGTNAPGI
jgi:hypothetical protein